MDNKIKEILNNERERQEYSIELIASENFTSDAVMELSGSIFTNKYAEGYPGKRYYNGCNNMDDIENLAIETLCNLYGANFANVQPHSGANANTAVYQALLKPGDKILGMSLSAGGHLSHGSKVNISGKVYEACEYGVNRDGLINMEEVRRIALKEKPKLIVAGASAYPRVIEWETFREIADEVGAYLVADMSHYSGLIAGGVYPSPIPHAHVITSTTHKTLRGPRGGIILWNDPDLSRKINSAVFPGTQGGPLMHIIAAKAQCFIEASQPEFKSYTKQVILNAQTMCRVFQSRGYKVLTGGTASHIVLLDFSDKPFSGRVAADALEKCDITVNKNSVPFDKRNFIETSGIRIGTAAMTTKLMMVESNYSFSHFEIYFTRLANLVCDILEEVNTGE